MRHELSHLLLSTGARTPHIYPLSLHDALPISSACAGEWPDRDAACWSTFSRRRRGLDRKSTRLNSSHLGISYAAFCLKKKTPVKEEPKEVVKEVKPTQPPLPPIVDCNASSYTG